MARKPYSPLRFSPLPAWGKGFHPTDGRPAALAYERKRDRFKRSTIPGGLTIGTNGTNYGYEQAGYGDITPTDVEGFEFKEVSVDGSDLFALQFVGNQQPSSVEKIEWFFPFFRQAPIVATWNGTNERYEAAGVAGLTAWMTRENGTQTPFAIKRPAVVPPTALEETTALLDGTELN